MSFSNVFVSKVVTNAMSFSNVVVSQGANVWRSIMTFLLNFHLSAVLFGCCSSFLGALIRSLW